MAALPAEPTAAPATARPNMPNVPRLLRERYLRDLTDDHANRLRDRSNLEASRRGVPHPCQPSLPPTPCTTDHHNAMAEAQVDDDNTTLLILANGPETEFWNHFTPNYLRSKEPNPKWHFLPPDPNIMKKRRNFANQIIGAHRIFQQDLAPLIEQGLFDPGNILPPIFTVCPVTNNWYPSADYTPGRDPFLHIHPRFYPPEINNQVFAFPARKPGDNINAAHRAASIDAMSTYAGYNDPYLPRHQDIAPTVIYSILKDGDKDAEVAGGPRGPWEMIPTTTKRVIGRSFRKADKDALTATRTRAANPMENYGAFDNIFNRPPTRRAPSATVTNPANTTRAETVPASSQSNSAEEAPEDETAPHNTSVEIVCEVDNSPVPLPSTHPTATARPAQPHTSTPSKPYPWPMDKQLTRKPLKKGSKVGGTSCARVYTEGPAPPHRSGPYCAVLRCPDSDHIDEPESSQTLASLRRSNGARTPSTASSTATAPAANNPAPASAPAQPPEQSPLSPARRRDAQPRQSPPRPPRRHTTARDRDTIRGLQAEISANRDTIQGLRTELNRSHRAELTAIAHTVDLQGHLIDRTLTPAPTRSRDDRRSPTSRYIRERLPSPCEHPDPTICYHARRRSRNRSRSRSPPTHSRKRKYSRN